MKKTIIISAVASLALNTYATNLDLETITVTTATKTEQSLKNVTANMNVITAEDIEERHYTTVVEALNSLPGVSFTSNGGLGTSKNVYLRGLNSKRTLVLIDGVRYNDITGLSGAPFAHLMINDIAQIEVLKGAQSGVWGADASAGVINIITKEATKGFHGSLNMEAGSYGTKKYGINTSYKAEKFDIKLGAQKVDADGFTAKATRGVSIDTFEDDAYKNTTLNLKLGLNFSPTDRVEIVHTDIDANAQYDGSNDAVDNTYALTKDKFSGIKYKHQDSFQKLELYVNRSSFDRDIYNSQFNGHYVYDGSLKEYGLRSTIDYMSNSFLTLGLDNKTFQQANSINTEYTNKGYSLVNVNVFDKTTITEAIRKDNYDKFDNKTTGKLGIKHQFSPLLFVSANYGTAYNVPTLYNLFGQFVANPNLKPETVKSYDLSVGYQGFEVSYFNSKVNDLIVYTTGYENVDGTSHIKGYELSWKKDILENTLITTSYTNLSAKDKDGIDLRRRAKQTLKASVDYYGIDKLHLGTTIEYVGDRYDDTAKTQSTGNYTVINATANYAFTPTLSGYIKLDNLTNKDYQTVEGYATSERAGYVGLKASF